MDENARGPLRCARGLLRRFAVLDTTMRRWIWLERILQKRVCKIGAGLNYNWT